MAPTNVIVRSKHDGVQAADGYCLPGPGNRKTEKKLADINKTVYPGHGLWLCLKVPSIYMVYSNQKQVYVVNEQTRFFSWFVLAKLASTCVVLWTEKEIHRNIIMVRTLISSCMSVISVNSSAFIMTLSVFHSVLPIP